MRLKVWTGGATFEKLLNRDYLSTEFEWAKNKEGVNYSMDENKGT